MSDKINVPAILDKYGWKETYNDSPSGLQAAIKEIIEAVIDKCAAYAETKKEIEYSDGIGSYEVQVIDKESILNIKKEIEYE